MFCPNCGKELEDDALVCIHCETMIEPEEESKPEEVQAEEKQSGKAEQVKKVIVEKIRLAATKKEQLGKWGYVIYRIVKLIVFCVIASQVYEAFQTAATSITRGGFGISIIESVGGKTLEEAYYAELGHIYTGYATITRALGTALSGILVGLGLTK